MSKSKKPVIVDVPDELIPVQVPVVNVKATTKEVAIPANRVAFTGVDEKGNEYSGFNTLKGVQAMKAFADKQGLAFSYDEKKNL